MVSRASFGTAGLSCLGALLWLVPVAHATRTEPLDPLVERPRPEEEPPPPAEEPPPSPPTPPGDVELLPPLPLARVAGIELPPEPAPSDPEEIVEERIDRDLRRVLRRDAITTGLVDGSFYDLGRAMRHELEVDPMDMQADVFRGLSLPEMLIRELGRYGPYERPIEPRGTPLPEASRRTMDADEVALDEMLDFQNLLNGHVTWYRAEIRVLQNRAGEVFDAQLLRSSGLPTIDRAALTAARRAVLDGPPPDDVLGDRETISSDWAIEVGDVGTQPGQAGCVDFDTPTTGGCAIAGRGILRFRFELLDVTDAEHPPD